jgi:hypothetical protein
MLEMSQRSWMLMGDEVVTVALWRGYVVGRFYARPADRDVAVAVSPSFRIVRWPWERRVSLDRDPDATAALEALQNALTEAGWQRISTGNGSGSRWYHGSFLRPAGRNGNGVRPVPEPANGHAVGALAGEVVAALQAGPLTSSELCIRVGRPSGVVRVARRELERAGQVQRAAPPAGRSRRAIYWQLSTMGPPGFEPGTNGL